MAEPSSAPPPRPESPDASAPREAPRPITDRLVTGTLVRHGPERLEFDPLGRPSYFVTILTERGERTLWGRGLERAILESRTQPRPGDAIGIRQNGIDPMSAVVRSRDDRGNVHEEIRIEKPRPHWIIERRDFFDERAFAAKALRDPRVSRHDVVRDHPELAGAYWALDSATKVASERIADRGSRDRFVALVREALAHAVERGEPLPRPVSRRASPPARAAAENASREHEPEDRSR